MVSIWIEQWPYVNEKYEISFSGLRFVCNILKYYWTWRHFTEYIKCQCCPHIETSQLIINQLNGFHMRTKLVFIWLIQKIAGSWTNLKVLYACWLIMHVNEKFLVFETKFFMTIKELYITSKSTDSSYFHFNFTQIICKFSYLIPLVSFYTAENIREP